MQDSFSRYAPRGSGLSLCRSLFNARLGSAAAATAAAAAAAAAASLTKRRFSKSPSVLTITRVSSYPWCETRQGSKIPLGDYFSLATLLPSRPTLHVPLPSSLPVRPGLSTNKDSKEYYRSEIRFLDVARRETFALKPVDFIPAISSRSLLSSSKRSRG